MKRTSRRPNPVGPVPRIALTSDDGDRFTLTAYVGARDVGELHVVGPQDDDSGDLWIATEIEVAEDVRRSGIGTALYEAAAREADARGGRLASAGRATHMSEGFWQKQISKGRAGRPDPSEGYSENVIVLERGVTSLKNNPKRSSRPSKLRRNTGTLYFRGTQGRDPAHTRLRQLSFTPCLGAALVYSAVPGDAWSSRSKTALTAESTVTAATIHANKVLDWTYLTMSLGDVLRGLRFGKEDGITEDEARRILNYMQNRTLGKVAAGEFKYRVFDEDGDAYSDWDDKPWDVLTTAISYIRDEWDNEPTIDTAARLAADTFVFVDAPVVQKVIERLGYQAVKYLDAFAAAESALEELLDVEPENVVCLEQEMDLDDDDVWCHETMRPLAGATVEYVWQGPATAVVQDVLAELRRDDDEIAANRKRKRR